MKQLHAVVLVLATLTPGTALAQPATVTVQVDVNPQSSAERVTLNRGSSAPVVLVADPGDSDGMVSVPVELLGTGIEEATISTSWEGTRSRLAVRLSTLFRNGIYVALFRRTSEAPPDPVDVSRECVGTIPADSETAFEMLFTCKDMALKLEAEGNRKWLITHRTALQGWLAANYYLYTAANDPSLDERLLEARITPYGVDPDLLARLEDVAARDSDNPNIDWLPLQIDDALELLTLVRDEDIRMIGLVPILRTESPEAALALNAAAITALQAGVDAGLYQVDLGVALGNQAELEQLVAQ